MQTKLLTHIWTQFWTQIQTKIGIQVQTEIKKWMAGVETVRWQADGDCQTVSVLNYKPVSSVCDDTQNLNETESETFYDTKFFRYRMRYFFDTFFFDTESHNFWKPIFFDTESETFQKIEKFLNREVLKPQRHTPVPMQITLFSLL